MMKVENKKKLVFSGIAVVLVVCLAVIIPSMIRNKRIGYIDDIYSKVNTPAWKELPKQTRVEAVELPADFIAKLTDEELAYAIIHYPFIGDIVVHDDWKTGYDHVLSFSGVLKEYDNRPNKQKIINEYLNSSLCTPEEKENYVYQLVWRALISLCES